MREAISRAIQHLEHNPREVKRFVNVFRFYALVQIGREILEQPAPDFDGTGKVALFAIRWPHLLASLGGTISAPQGPVRTFTFLELAARAVDGNATLWRVLLDATGLPASVRAELAAPELREAFALDPLVGDAAIAFL